MSTNNKWPDFRLASTLRSLIRSQPDEAAKTRSGRHSVQKEREELLEETVNDNPDDPRRDDAGATMADVDDNSIAGSEGSVGEADVDQLPGGDADFGAIEMFDSNAAPATFSSQAPLAVMSEDAPLESSAKKSKRDKKEKREKKRKSSQEDTIATSPIPEVDDSSRKHRKPKRQSTKDVEIPDSQPHQKPAERSADTPWGQLQEEEAAAASSQTKKKKKRKLSDSADGKGRKKRRSHDQDTEDQETGSSTFLRKRKDKRGVAESAIYEDNEPESDTQGSPTVAHLRRRSQSREARSRENSVLAGSQMEVDVGEEDQPEADAAASAEADGDVERLAREAWNEHRNGQQALEEKQNGDQDTEMPDQYPQEPLNAALEDIAEAEPSSAKSKKTRSSRKKAKPTYFEQDPIPDIAGDDETNKNALGELPSPSAATPKARRAKRAAKKESRGRKPKREKLSQSMRGASADAADGDFGTTPGQSRNRLDGFTQGRFTDAELARIARAVEQYRAENDISQREVNELIHAAGGTTAGATHAQLWHRIFAECPDRHRQKVINITRKKFHNFVARGTWTPEQDAELTELINQHGTKWSYIAGLVNRHPEDLRDRYRNYIVCGPNQRKDAWDEHEEARLTQHIIESMMAIDQLRIDQPSRSVLQKSYLELIDWQNISELMGRTRSRLQCITKWKSLNINTHGKDHLISSQPDSQISFRLEKARRQISAMPVEERYRLVMAINNTGVATDAKIPWQRLVDKPFRNQWHRYTQMLLWRRLKQHVPNWETASVRNCAHYLIEQYNQTGDLPDVPDELFDDSNEMHYMQAITPVSSAPGAQDDERNQISAEFVTGSDAEDDTAETNGDAEQNAAEEEDEVQEESQEAEIKIDPALAEIAQPAKKSTPAKTPGSRKRGRKAAAAVEDDIEDATQDPQQTQEEHDSEIDVEQFRKKKTPSKFKSPRRKKAGQHTSPVPDDADSVMDDMEDLPAQIANAETA